MWRVTNWQKLSSSAFKRECERRERRLAKRAIQLLQMAAKWLKLEHAKVTVILVPFRLAKHRWKKSLVISETQSPTGHSWSYTMSKAWDWLHLVLKTQSKCLPAKGHFTETQKDFTWPCVDPVSKKSTDAVNAWLRCGVNSEWQSVCPYRRRWLQLYANDYDDRWWRLVG